MHRPPNNVGVGGSSARVLGYVDVAVFISDVEVRHPLIVVDTLAYPLLIGTDVLRPHRAIYVLGAPEVVRLKLDRCSVCVEERLPDSTLRVIVGAVASTLVDTTLPPHTASRVQVCLPPKVLGDSHFLAEPLLHELATASCAALPSVCTIIGPTNVLSVVSLSDKPVNLCAGTPIAAVSSLTPKQLSQSSNTAAIQHLPRIEKIRKVLIDLNFDATKLDAPTKLVLHEMIDEFIDVFAECDSDVGLTNVVFHEIDTGASRPLRHPARRIPYGEQRNAVESEIGKLLENGVARPSTLPWASPVVMVKKKDCFWRMCVDYCRVNAATKFDCFPLPRLGEALEAVAECSVLSSLDLAMAYHQVPVAPSNVEKTAFITHTDLFEITKMPFGLCNAPSTYQRLMSIVLRGLMTRICLAYLDNVIVYSRHHAQH